MWWAGFFAIGVFAAFMSGLAYVDQLPDVFRHAGVDKVAHFALAGLLAFFLDGALRRRQLVVASVTVPLASALVLVPVGLEELCQSFTVYRTSSLWDFAADLAGVLFLVPLSRRAAA